MEVNGDNEVLDGNEEAIERWREWLGALKNDDDGEHGRVTEVIKGDEELLKVNGRGNGKTLKGRQKGV